MANDDDEFFCNQEENNDDDAHQDGLAQYEAQSTKEQFRNMGYLAAFDQAKEERLQEGFQAGYTQYFEAAMKLGQMLGKVTSPIQQQEGNDESSLLESNESVQQVVQNVRSFLVGVDKQDNNDSSTVTDSLESLTKQIEDLLLKKP